MAVVYASPSHNPTQTSTVSVLVGPVAAAVAALHYTETDLAVDVAATVTSTDQVDLDELALTTTAAATVSTTDQADFEDHPLTVDVAADITSTDLHTTHHYDETERTVTVAVVVTTLDQADLEDHPVDVSVVAAVTGSDRLGGKELALTTIGATTVTTTERNGYRQLALPVDVDVTVTTTDIYTGVNHYVETGRQADAAATVTTTDRADFEDVTTSPGDVTVTSADRAGRRDVSLTVTAAAAVTAADQADFEDHPLDVSAVATIVVFDVLAGAPIHYPETGRNVVVAATVTGADRASFHAVVSVAASSTLAAATQWGGIETLAVGSAAVTLMTDAASLVESATIEVVADVTIVVVDVADLYPRRIGHRERVVRVSHREHGVIAYREHSEQLVHQE